MRRIVFVAIVMLLAMSACKGKTAKKVQTPQPAPVAVVEELKEDPVVEEVVPDPVIEAPTTSANDRYFLIAASFQELSNAEKYKQSLVNKGLSAQIIQRNDGPNSDFYKVAYMSFHSWKEAIKALGSERATPGKEGVWLLVKK